MYTIYIQFKSLINCPKQEKVYKSFNKGIRVG